MNCCILKKEKSVSILFKYLRHYNDCKDFLNRTIVSDFETKKNSVISCESTEKMGSIMEKLFTHKFTASPIIDRNEESSHVDFIDYIDIVAYVVQYYKTNGISPILDSFFNTPCSWVAGEFHVGKNSRNDFVTNIHDCDPLMKVLESFASSSKLHRLPVYNSSGEFSGLISQSDIVNMLSNYLCLSLENSTVETLQLGYKKEIFSANVNDNLIDVFQLILAHHISGLPILKDGLLVGNISASDIKRIGTNPVNLEVLATKAGDFMTSPPIVVFPHTPFKDVCELVQNDKIHRVYLVDLSFQLLGVVSLFDILSLVYKSL